MRLARSPLSALVVLASAVSGIYDVDPLRCAGKLSDDDCVLNGASDMHVGKKQTCLQCIIKRPGVASWGCTLDELREWCNAGEGELPKVEKPPQDILEEEKQSPKDYIPLRYFEKEHGDQIQTLHKKVRKR